MMVMPLFVILIGVVLVVLVVRTVIGLDGGRGSRQGLADGEDTAVRILRERYARGEITEDEFLDRKAMLEVGRHDRLGR